MLFLCIKLACVYCVCVYVCVGMHVPLYPEKTESHRKERKLSQSLKHRHNCVNVSLSMSPLLFPMYK